MVPKPGPSGVQKQINLLYYEHRARYMGYQLIAGVDEVGRGPLAGPVVAAAVILPEKPELHGINDSKKLSHARRLKLFSQIKQQAISIGVAAIKESIIDKINILQATHLAMHQAITHLNPAPDYLLLDAVRLPQLDIPQQPIIKGDSQSCSIAAASIMAKVIRDELMCLLAKRYPQYYFEQHKGYGTKTHLAALRQHGPSPIHRLSFKRVLV
jgi:ribonuclease HII